MRSGETLRREATRVIGREVCAAVGEGGLAGIAHLEGDGERDPEGEVRTRERVV